MDFSNPTVLAKNQHPRGRRILETFYCQNSTQIGSWKFQMYISLLLENTLIYLNINIYDVCCVMILFYMIVSLDLYW